MSLFRFYMLKEKMLTIWKEEKWEGAEGYAILQMIFIHIQQFQSKWVLDWRVFILDFSIASHQPPQRNPQRTPESGKVIQILASFFITFHLKQTSSADIYIFFFSAMHVR